MEKSIEFIKRNYGSLTLAYIGDAYYELLARERIAGIGNCRVSDLNDKIKKYVTAVSQSRIVETLLPLLDENELYFYKYGRNAHNTHRSKSAQALEYRRATGLECVFGFLYLSGAHSRARELFDIASESIN